MCSVVSRLSESIHHLWYKWVLPQENTENPFFFSVSFKHVLYWDALHSCTTTLSRNFLSLIENISFEQCLLSGSPNPGPCLTLNVFPMPVTHLIFHQEPSLDVFCQFLNWLFFFFFVLLNFERHFFSHQIPQSQLSVKVGEIRQRQARVEFIRFTLNHSLDGLASQLSALPVSFKHTFSSCFVVQSLV